MANPIIPQGPIPDADTPFLEDLENVNQPWYRFFLSLYKSALGLKVGGTALSVDPGAASPTLYLAPVAGTFITDSGNLHISRDGANHILLTANAVWCCRGDTAKVVWGVSTPVLYFLPSGPANASNTIS